jgi:heat shock protein HslJ
MEAWKAPLSAIALVAVCTFGIAQAEPVDAKSCGTKATKAKAAPKMQTLTDTNWVLRSFVEGGVETAAIHEITLNFGADGRAGGNSGCNSYGADFKAQPSGLSFGPIMATKRACADEGPMKQETQLFRALETAGKYQVANDKLTIYYGDGKNQLNFVKAAAKASP